MPKCPWCGSSAQLKLMASKYNEDGWTIEVVRYYICGCGQTSMGKSYFHCQDAYEEIEPFPMPER